MSTTYLVEIDMRMKGDLVSALTPAAQKLDELAGQASKLGEALKTLGSPVEVGLELKGDLVPGVTKLVSGLEDANKQANELASTLGGIDAKVTIPDAGKGRDPISPGAPIVPKLQEAERETSKLGQAVRGFGRTATGVFTGVVEKVGAMTMGFAAAGAAAGVGALTYGVMKLNKEFEDTKISLATIFTARGQSSDLQQGLGMAAESMARMRRDAAALPGEMHELLYIFQTIATPGFNAGMTREQLEGVAAQTMAASKVVGIATDMAGRELAQLLEGRAGVHNVLGMRIGIGGGDQAQAFNQLAPEARLQRIMDELAKFEPSFEVFEKSFDGASATFINSAKEFLRVATEPVFGKLTDALGRINKWVEDNEARIEVWTSLLGQKLSEAWDWGTQKVEEWWPAVEAFATNAFVRLKSIWEDVQPYVERFGEAMKKALEDPGTIDKLITLLKLYAGVKVAGGVADAVGGWGNLASIGKGVGGGAFKFGKRAVFEGGLHAIRWGAGASAGAAAAGAGAGVGAGAAGGAAAAGGTGAMLAGGAVAAGAATIALSGLALAGWQASELFAEVSRDWGANERAMYESAMRTVEDAGKSAEANEHVRNMMRKLEIAGDETAAAAIRLKLSFYEAEAGALSLANNLADIRKEVDVPYDPMMGHMSFISPLLHGSPDGKAGKNKSKPPRHPGGAGMNVQKVEIVVTSNQDPSRIARLVSAELANLRRHPRVSPHVPNYSASQ